MLMFFQKNRQPAYIRALLPRPVAHAPVPPLVVYLARLHLPFSPSHMTAVHLGPGPACSKESCVHLLSGSEL
jgi:hypothetical protein